MPKGAWRVHEWQNQKPPLGYGIRTDGKEAWATNDLKFCVLMNEGAGAPRLLNLANNVQSTPDGGRWHPKGVDLDGATDRLDWVSPADLADAPTTIMLSFYSDICDSYEIPICLGNPSNTATGSMYTMFRHSGDAAPYSICFRRIHVTEGVMEHRASANSFASGRWNDLVLTHTGSTTATDMHIYVNGLEVADYDVATDGTSVQHPTTGYWSVGGIYAADTRCFDGKIGSVHTWNRVLSPREVAELYRRPYCMIEPYSFGRVLYIPPVGGWLPPRIRQVQQPIDPRLIY